MAKLKPMEFYDRIIYVVRNFVVYNQYDKDSKKAAKVIHKYFPEKTIEECTRCFNETCKAYDDAIIFIEENKDYYRDYFEKLRNYLPVSPSQNQLAFLKKHSQVPSEIIETILHWVFNWYQDR